MSRYKPKPNHNASWLIEHQSEKYEKQISAGKNALQKFLNKTNNKYFAIFINNGFLDLRSQKFKSGYLTYQNDNGTIYSLCNFNWSKCTCEINNRLPPKHMIIDIETSMKSTNSIDLEKLFSKSNNDWKIYYFDDEESMKLFVEMMKGD